MHGGSMFLTKTLEMAIFEKECFKCVYPYCIGNVHDRNIPCSGACSHRLSRSSTLEGEVIPLIESARSSSASEKALAAAEIK